jgi:hypothetical protein
MRFIEWPEVGGKGGCRACFAWRNLTVLDGARFSEARGFGGNQTYDRISKAMNRGI